MNPSWVAQKDEKGDQEKRPSKRLGRKTFAPFPIANVMWALQVRIADALTRDSSRLHSDARDRIFTAKL